MNKAFIAICFSQSLPDLPPLGRHVPLTAFYRLVKAELFGRSLVSLTQLKPEKRYIAKALHLITSFESHSFIIAFSK